MLLLLAVAVTTCGRRHHIKKGTGLLVGESEDDIRDNVFNYDEQGGGEEDEVRSQVKVGTILWSYSDKSCLDDLSVCGLSLSLRRMPLI